MTYAYQADPRFDAIRKLSFNDLMAYSRTSIDAEKLVDEYRAAIDAANKAELLKWAADVAARPNSAFDNRDKNFYL